jgi:hypothetical protein
MATLLALEFLFALLELRIFNDLRASKKFQLARFSALTPGWQRDYKLPPATDPLVRTGCPDGVSSLTSISVNGRDTLVAPFSVYVWGAVSALCGCMGVWHGFRGLGLVCSGSEA